MNSTHHIRFSIMYIEGKDYLTYRIIALLFSWHNPLIYEIRKYLLLPYRKYFYKNKIINYITLPSNAPYIVCNNCSGAQTELVSQIIDAARYQASHHPTDSISMDLCWKEILLFAAPNRVEIAIWRTQNWHLQPYRDSSLSYFCMWAKFSHKHLYAIAGLMPHTARPTNWKTAFIVLRKQILLFCKSIWNQL